MGRKRKCFSEQDVLRAVEGSGGIVSTVARRLRCSWAKTRDLLNEYPAAREVFEMEREMVLDEAELALVKAIRAGNVAAAKWMLSRLGKHRGYGDSVTAKSEDVHVVFRWEDSTPGSGGE